MADHSNSAAAQRRRLHTYLHAHNRITTLQARSTLDVMHPAARVQELGEAGLNIVTHWREDETPEQGKHRVAEYVLLPGKRKTPAKTGAKSNHNSTGGSTDD